MNHLCVYTEWGLSFWTDFNICVPLRLVENISSEEWEREREREVGWRLAWWTLVQFPTLHDPLSNFKDSPWELSPATRCGPSITEPEQNHILRALTEWLTSKLRRTWIATWVWLWRFFPKNASSGFVDVGWIKEYIVLIKFKMISMFLFIKASSKTFFLVNQVKLDLII